jgi:hypothetical protein
MRCSNAQYKEVVESLQLYFSVYIHNQIILLNETQSSLWSSSIDWIRSIKKF